VFSYALAQGQGQEDRRDEDKSEYERHGEERSDYQRGDENKVAEDDNGHLVVEVVKSDL
jgi:hypothetical protein